jgi:hypothetical protein
MKLFAALCLFFTLSIEPSKAGCPSASCETDNGINYGRVSYGYGKVAYIHRIDSFMVTLQRSFDCGGISSAIVLYNNDTLKFNVFSPKPFRFKLYGKPGKYKIDVFSLGDHFYYEFELIMIIGGEVGINEVYNTQFQAVINPNNELIITAIENIRNISIYTLNGTKVYFSECSSSRLTIPFHDHPYGIYYILVESVNQKFGKKKIVKD